MATGKAMDTDPLGLSAQRMRQLGYRMVDFLVDQLGDPGSLPALRRASRDEMEARLHRPAPLQPTSFEQILDQLAVDVLPYMSRGDHPGYFAFIPSCTTWPSALGDLVAVALNIYAGSWMESAGPSQVELTILDWFRQWIGYPESAAGVLVSGGSAANMTALACAREARVGPMNDRVVAYVSDQAHSSMARGGRVLGFRPDQVRVLPVDRRLRMRADALAAAIEADRRAGYVPLFVSAAAGSTNTGAVDPLPEIAAICRREDVWLHVDAAYGGFAALTERGKALLAGIDRADSVTLDPHKWLYQPFECGCLLVRDGGLLRSAFEITPDYLKDAEISQREINFSDLGIQLTRMSRALKLWVSLHYFGVDAYRQAIDRTLDLAAMAQERIEERDEFELMMPATLSVVCFRRRFGGVQDEEELEWRNAELVRQLAESGTGLISSTRLHGRYALRLCVLNHTSGPADVHRVLDWLETVPIAAAAGVRLAGLGRLDDVERRFGQRVSAAVADVDLRSVPLFETLSDGQVAFVKSSSREVTAGPGDPIIQQWAPTRDFYVVLEGSVDVTQDDRLLKSLLPGQFFGEMAAMDWGASFGYSRTASVVSTSPSRLLVLPADCLQQLLRESPAVKSIVSSQAWQRSRNE
jgi:glutamate/tyrosine decarboxylase-like PLP-dependent enzyme